MRHVVISLLLPSSATFATFADTPKKVSELIANGRALEAQGKHSDAAAAFEAALAITADDATAMAELGWVQYELKDLAKAEATTRKALERLAHPEHDWSGDQTARLQAAALYNLGRILEDRGDKPGAIAAYVDALKIRSSPAVRAQLRKLDAAKADALDPYAPVRMKGPFPSIAAFCTSVSTPGKACTCGEAIKDEGTTKLAAPFEAVAVSPRQGCKDDAEQVLDLAIKLADGWYIDEVSPIAVVPSISVGHCGPAIWHYRGTTLQAHKPIAMIEYTTQGSCYHKSNDWGWDQRSLAVIGVGASKAASATEITTKLDITNGTRPGRDVAIAVRLTWNKDGSFELAGKIAPNIVEPDPANRLGKHPLAFP